jgi:cysteine desulfurase family protein
MKTTAFVAISTFLYLLLFYCTLLITHYTLLIVLHIFLRERTKMINFDNAATTFPKPENVRKAVDNAVRTYGNSGRGGHSLSMAGGEAVFKARQAVADFFGGTVENTIFTLNTTMSLNIAIKGIMKKGGHIVTSSMEHNSVTRPIVAEKYDYSVFSCGNSDGKEFDDETVVKNFLLTLRPDTRVVVCTLASNVTGRILPFREIGRICQERGVCFIADSAQASGIIPINLKADNINVLCSAGHKGLYGITGTGVLVTDGKFHINHILEGGTGSSSLETEQPDILPDSLESGTLNIPGIMSVLAGIEFINSKGIEKIHEYEKKLCGLFISHLKNMDNVQIYRTEGLKYAPIVSFNIKNTAPEDVAEYLNNAGFALRSGFHCSALGHKTLGTTDGTVRFAPSVFNRPSEVEKLVLFIKKLQENY